MEQLRQIRDKKLEQVKESIQNLERSLEERNLSQETRDSITALSYPELKEKLQSGSTTPSEVLAAYQSKALEVHKEINCLTGIIDSADAVAQKLDGLSKGERGRLHGIPLSVKDAIAVEGYDTTFGCVSKCFKPRQRTTCVVQALINEGMVPFVQCNASQCCMLSSCDNPVFGETLNPINHKRTCGGSSGGDAALAASGGTPTGLGTDMGGSNRIPPSYCGIFGFKPSNLRVGVKNLPMPDKSLESIYGKECLGPITADFDLMVDMMRVLFSPALFDLDRLVPRLHFDEESFNSTEPMTIGYYTSFSDDAIAYPSVPAVQRAVEETVEALKQRGHTLVEWQPPRILYAIQLAIRTFFMDGGDGVYRFSKEERFLCDDFKDSVGMGRFGYFSKSLMMSLARKFVSPMAANFLDGARGLKSVGGMGELASEIQAYLFECEQSFTDAKLDGFIGPVMPFVAPPIGQSKDVQFGIVNTMIYNFLDYPAGVVPVTHVTEEDVNKLCSSYPTTNKSLQPVVTTQKESVGMPVSIQCISIKWRDEVALRIMKEVKDAMKK